MDVNNRDLHTLAPLPVFANPGVPLGDVALARAGDLERRRCGDRSRRARGHRPPKPRGLTTAIRLVALAPSPSAILSATGCILRSIPRPDLRFLASISLRSGCQYRRFLTYTSSPSSSLSLIFEQLNMNSHMYRSCPSCVGPSYAAT